MEVAESLIVEEGDARMPGYGAFIRDAQGLLLLDSSDPAHLGQISSLFDFSSHSLPDDAVAWAGLARMEGMKDKPHLDSGREIDLWKKAIAADPRRAEFLLGLAKAYRRAGKLSEAIAQDRAAVREDPSFGLAFTDLGICLDADHKSAEAAAAWEQGMRIPESAEFAGWLQGTHEYDARHYPQALSSLLTSTAAAEKAGDWVDPNQAEAWFRIACIYSIQHKEEEGKDALQHANRAGLHEIARFLHEPALRWLLERVKIDKVVAEGKP